MIIRKHGSRRRRRFGLCWLAAALLSGCAGRPQLHLHRWDDLPGLKYAIPPYAKYLRAYKIALDPGHGGLARLPGYKRGPTGKREAVANLNVARYVKALLERVGVEVVLTRTTDTYVSLQERVDIAAAAGCDFLISLHHNASDNPQTNYVSVFYHLHPDFSPFSLDLARSIYFSLVENLRLPQVAADGLLSDRLIYPAGFGLLRRARLPAILLETSFFSNPKEEKRLADLRYNQREAYAIFLGLARWAAGGVPSATLVKPPRISLTKRPEIVYALQDGIGERGGRTPGEALLLSESIGLKVNGVPVQPSVDLRQKQLFYRPDSALPNGATTLQVSLQNLFKNHNLPRTDTLIVAAPADSIALLAAATELPADTSALLPVAVAAFDSDGMPVWTGTRVHLRASRGTLSQPSGTLQQTGGIFYYRAAADTGRVYITATADSVTDTLAIALHPPGTHWLLSGIVLNDSTRTALPSARISLRDSVYARTDTNGVFVLLDPPAGPGRWTISMPGFAPEVRPLTIDTLRSRLLLVRLRPRLGGILHGEAVVIDADGGQDNGDALPLRADDAARHLANALADTLAWAGVHTYRVPHNVAANVHRRIEWINAIPEGWYLKVRYKKTDGDSLWVGITTYPGSRRGEQIARSLGEAFAAIPGARVALFQNTDVPEVTLTNKTAVQVEIAGSRFRPRERDLPALFGGILLFKQNEAAREAGTVPEPEAQE